MKCKYLFLLSIVLLFSSFVIADGCADLRTRCANAQLGSQGYVCQSQFNEELLQDYLQGGYSCEAGGVSYNEPNFYDFVPWGAFCDSVNCYCDSGYISCPYTTGASNDLVACVDGSNSEGYVLNENCAWTKCDKDYERLAEVEIEINTGWDFETGEFITEKIIREECEIVDPTKPFEPTDTEEETGCDDLKPEVLDINDYLEINLDPEIMSCKEMDDLIFFVDGYISLDNFNRDLNHFR